MNPLGKRVNINFSSSPDTPFIRQELFTASRAVCVWAPPPPSWTNLPKDPPSKTAVLHKKAQTDTLIILKPCGSGCADPNLRHHFTTGSHSKLLTICYCCCFLFQTKSLWWFSLRNTFRRKSAINLSQRTTKRIQWLSSRDVSPFYNWRFSRSDHCGKRVKRKESFYSLKFPSLFIVDWTRTDGWSLRVFTLTPRNPMTKKWNLVAFRRTLSIQIKKSYS